MPLIKINKYKPYPPDILKHLHDVEIMILEDFINFCNKHEIIYFMDGGSLLGCARHNGFIPWDDDIDIIMFRDQYEKFLMYNFELTDKYDILNSDNYEYYCRLYSKLSLKGTKVDEIYDNNTDFSFGINIDIFVLDNIPEGKFKRKIFKLERNLFNRILSMYEITTCDLYVSKNKEKLGHIIRFLFKVININNNSLKKWGNKLINKSKSCNSKYVCNLSTSYGLFNYDKNLFKKTKKLPFENLNVLVPKEYEEYLTIIYGDYMKLPPIEERINHGFSYIDFGKY